MLLPVMFVCLLQDYEVAAPTPETRSAISLRKDRDDDQFSKVGGKRGVGWGGREVWGGGVVRNLE